MPPERWRTVRRLLERALEQASERREPWLARACRGDEALRHEVNSLLCAHKAAGQFIECPLLRVEIAASRAPNGP